MKVVPGGPEPRTYDVVDTERGRELGCRLCGNLSRSLKALTRVECDSCGVDHLLASSYLSMRRMNWRFFWGHLLLVTLNTLSGAWALSQGSLWGLLNFAVAAMSVVMATRTWQRIRLAGRLRRSIEERWASAATP